MDTPALERKVINLAERKKQRLGGLPAPEIKVEIPDFIEPRDIMSMSDEQMDQILSLIRLRRLQAASKYEQTEREKTELSMSKARDALERKAAVVFKDLERTFAILDKLELHVNELRALRVQAGLEF